MKFSLALAALAGTAVASNWFGTKPLYNKWHETELERWLSDNNVPYPTPADRKDLENLIKDNWEANVVQPYNSWETPQLSKYLSAKGQELKKGTEQNKDSLIAQVKSSWAETESQATDAYESVKNWIFDTWSESQLKAFLDRHGIPNPQPRTRDSLLSSAREGYQGAAEKAKEYTNYPGDWLYHSWSDSDLKSWMDERGVPVPQPSSRDKLIAAVRRNSYVARSNVGAYASGASASISSAGSVASASMASAGSAATQKVADVLLDTWSESEIKNWCDKNGIKVPQGSKKNEMLALARKKYAELTGDNVSASASSAYGAATSKAGNLGAQATEGFQQYFYEYLNWAKMQIGIGASSASSYASDAYGTASASARSAASMISNSAVSVAYAASASAESAYSLASVSAASASAAATDAAGSSAYSAASAASKSAYSASSVASKSALSLSSSLSSAASSASVSASKAAASSGPKVAKQAGDAAAESLSYGKHRVQEAFQKATDYVKEEL